MRADYDGEATSSTDASHSAAASSDTGCCRLRRSTESVRVVVWQARRAVPAPDAHGFELLDARLPCIHGRAPISWPADPVSGTVTELGDVHLWLGLKNSDDTGTWFDIRIEVLWNGTPFAAGETTCVQSVVRNPD